MSASQSPSRSTSESSAINSGTGVPPVSDAAQPSLLKEWLRLAAYPATARRAFITAIIVGSVLIAINHGRAIVSGQLTRERIIQMCLTVLVPYTVSTVSSVATRRELAKLNSGKPGGLMEISRGQRPR